MTSVAIVTGAASGIGAACARRARRNRRRVAPCRRQRGRRRRAAPATSPSSGATCEPVVVDLTDDGSGRSDSAADARSRGTLRTRRARRRNLADDGRLAPRPRRRPRRHGAADRRAAPARRVRARRSCASPRWRRISTRSRTRPPTPRVDDPRADGFFDAYAAAVGEPAPDPGIAYAWAKRGVQRLVRREAAAFGAVGARICSVSPGMIDTPMGRQEYEQQPMMKVLEDMTPLRRIGRADELAAVVQLPAVRRGELRHGHRRARRRRRTAPRSGSSADHGAART